MCLRFELVGSCMQSGEYLCCARVLSLSGERLCAEFSTSNARRMERTCENVACVWCGLPVRCDTYTLRLSRCSQSGRASTSSCDVLAVLPHRTILGDCADCNCVASGGEKLV